MRGGYIVLDKPAGIVAVTEAARARGSFTLALLSDAASFRGASLTSVGQLTREGVELVCATAGVMRSIVDRKGGCDVLRHRVRGVAGCRPSRVAPLGNRVPLPRAGARERLLRAVHAHELVVRVRHAAPRRQRAAD